MSENTDPVKVGIAAREFVNAAIDGLADEKGVHAETVIAAVARMAGTFLFRSFGFELPDAAPGQPVLSEIANEKGPHLVEILSTLLADAGIHPDLNKVDEDSRPQHAPLRSFLDTQKLLEPTFDRIRKDLGLSLTEAADAAAVASAMLIQQTTQVLDPNMAFDIAVFSMIEGAKTKPADV